MASLGFKVTWSSRSQLMYELALLLSKPVGLMLDVGTFLNILDSFSLPRPGMELTSEWASSPDVELLCNQRTDSLLNDDIPFSVEVSRIWPLLNGNERVIIRVFT
jgi:hypothetical protein